MNFGKRHLLWILPLAGLLLSSCKQQEVEKPDTSQMEWSPHEKQLLEFIAHYKTEDPEQAQQAMTKELEYLNNPLDEALSDEDLAYLRAISLIRLGMVSHHLGQTSEAKAHFEEGTREFNAWCSAVGKDEHEQDQVIAAVIGFDQDFCAKWHEPWKTQLGIGAEELVVD